MMHLNWYTRMRWFLCSPEKKASRSTAWALGSLPGPCISRSWCMLTCRGYPELAYYRNFIMQQDNKFIWPTVQMYDIRYHAMCAHHGCPFTMTDQALMATILDATAVKVSAHKCFHCGRFDHLVDRCHFPQTASLEMAETSKKGAWVKQMPNPGPAKSSSLTQMGKWFHNGREGCNNYQQDRLHFPLQMGPYLLQL